MRTNGRVALMLATALVLTLAARSAGGQNLQFRPIVMSGQAVPGMPGFTFGDTFLAMSNDTGNVLFQSRLIGPDVTTANDDAFWIGDGSSISKVVREGDQVPGLPAGVHFSYEAGTPIVRIADGGHIYLKNMVRGPNVGISNDEYLFSGRAGSLEIIARETSSIDQQMPDSFESFQNNTGGINSSGKVLFSGTRKGEQSVSTWLSSDGSLTRIPSGGGHLNNEDDIGIGGTSLRILPAGSTTPQTIVTAGDAAPGTENGVQFDRFDIGFFNNSRQVVFRPTLSGPGVTSTNSYGYWVGQVGDVRKVLRAGDEVPGLPGVFWSGGTFLPSLSDNGRVAIELGLTGSGVDASNNGVIVTGAPGDVRIIAREGDQAPGLESGVVHLFMSTPAIDDSGRVAFTSQLSGPGVTDQNRIALWEYTPDDDMVRMLLRSGDVLEVSPGDFRTIQAIGLGSYRPLHMSDLVTFRASFTDGTSGIFVASVPEPASLLLLASGWLIFFRRSQRAVNQQHHGDQTLLV